MRPIIRDFKWLYQRPADRRAKPPLPGALPFGISLSDSRHRAIHLPAFIDALLATERASLAVSRAAVGCPGEVIAAVSIHLSREYGIMQAAIAPRGDARTFLTHFVGGGLDDDRHVVEKFRSLANGDIVPVDQPARKGRRKARRIIVSLKAVEKMRPARDEIIIATGVKLRECGVQLWGWRATGIFSDRRQRG